MMISRNRTKKHRSAHSRLMSSAPEDSLSGFRPVMWPTVFPAKLVYSDYRPLTCVASQVEYVYRLNSLFDPDQSGVGGQPDGFDQLKALYGRYRVMAVDVEVQAVGQSANGLITCAPTDTPGGFTSAEEVAGLRYAKTAAFSSTQVGRLKTRYHIGKLLGYSDDAMLGNSNVEAAITASPSFQQYLVIAVEGGSSATQVQNVWVRLTYYARMEVPIAVIDTTIVHSARFVARIPASLTNSHTGSDSGDHPVSCSQLTCTPVPSTDVQARSPYLTVTSTATASTATALTEPTVRYTTQNTPVNSGGPGCAGCANCTRGVSQ